VNNFELTYNRLLKITSILVILLSCIFFATNNSHAQISALKRWSGFIRLSWYLRGISILTTQDKAWSGPPRRSYYGEFKIILDWTNTLGDVGFASRLSYGILGFSLLTKDARFQDAAFTSLESQLVSQGIVNFLKDVIGRSRPSQGKGSLRFEPFSGDDSFPSGHTVTAFALIAPWIFYYPNTFSYALFILPTGTAVARMALDAHWATDVLAGAAIGTIVSYYLTKWHQGKPTQRRISISIDQTSLRLIYYPPFLG
jgi:membrane-associated phospholipid phosphatase